MFDPRRNQVLDRHQFEQYLQVLRCYWNRYEPPEHFLHFASRKNIEYEQFRYRYGVDDINGLGRDNCSRSMGELFYHYFFNGSPISWIPAWVPLAIFENLQQEEEMDYSDSENSENSGEESLSRPPGPIMPN